MQVILLYQLHELLDLIGLGISFDVLQINWFRDFWMDKDMVAPLDSGQMKSESFNQVDHISKPYVPGPIDYLLQHSFSFHTILTVGIKDTNLMTSALCPVLSALCLLHSSALCPMR